MATANISNCKPVKLSPEVEKLNCLISGLQVTDETGVPCSVKSLVEDSIHTDLRNRSTVGSETLLTPSDEVPHSQERLMCEYGELYLSPGNVLTLFIPELGRRGSCAGNQFVEAVKKEEIVGFIRRNDVGHDECHKGIEKSWACDHAHIKLKPELSRSQIISYIRELEGRVTASKDNIRDCVIM